MSFDKVKKAHNRAGRTAPKRAQTALVMVTEVGNGSIKVSLPDSVRKHLDAPDDVQSFELGFQDIAQASRRPTVADFTGARKGRNSKHDMKVAVGDALHLDSVTLEDGKAMTRWARIGVRKGENDAAPPTVLSGALQTSRFTSRETGSVAWWTTVVETDKATPPNRWMTCGRP